MEGIPRRGQTFRKMERGVNISTAAGLFRPRKGKAMNEVKMIYFSRPFYYPVKDGAYKHEDFHIGLLIGRKRALAVLVWHNHKPYAKVVGSACYPESVGNEYEFTEDQRKDLYHFFTSMKEDERSGIFSHSMNLENHEVE